MKRIVCAAAATIATLLGSSASAGGYFNPEFQAGYSGSSSTGSSLDLHVGYKDGPFFIQAGPAMSNDSTNTDWGFSGKAGVAGQVDESTNLYAEVGLSKFGGSDTGTYVKTGAYFDF